MGLVKRTYTDNVTVITAENLNDIQDEIILQGQKQAEDEVTLALKADKSTITDLNNTFNIKAFRLPYAKRTQKNIFDPASSETGSIKSNGTVDANATQYKTTSYIWLQAGESITISPKIRKFMAYANPSLAVIAGSYVNDETTEPYTFTAASECFVRFSYRNANADETQVEYGTQATAYVKPEPYLDPNMLLSSKQIEQTKEALNTGLNYVSKWQKNIFDPSISVRGYLKSDGSITDTSSTTYKTSGIIFVAKDQSITISPTLRKFIAFSDAEATTVIANTFVNDETSEPYTYTAAVDSYVRFSYRIANENLTQAEYGTVATEYMTPEPRMEQDVLLGETQLNQVGMRSILTGKKWVPCGDSFTEYTNAQFSDGRFSGKNKTYPRLIAERCDMDLNETFFYSGRTLAYPENPDGFVNSLTYPNASYNYQNIPADADYITIYLGINDAHHAPGSGGGDGEDNTGEIPIGTIDDNTIYTYLGAYNVVLSWLITNRPNAHIGIIVSNGIQGNDAYRQGQIAIAKKYGIAYIDLNGDERTPAMLRTSNPDIASGVKTALIQKWAVDPSSNTHANAAAHEFESTFIENFLKSI